MTVDQTSAFEGSAVCASQIGDNIRRQRKALKVSATAAAESAGMSRLTWYKIEKGEITVSIGAYLSAAHVVGLKLQTAHSISHAFQQTNGVGEDWIPLRIHLTDFPQLRKLAWQVSGVDTLTPAEALDIYERNWRHLDESALIDEEQKLINGLKLVFSRAF
jgi:transcriptional regulator with XRE-family HTH domain